MGAETKNTEDNLGRRKPASAQQIKVTSTESTLGLDIMAWLEVHKQKLVVAAGVIIAAVIIGVIYNHYAASRELSASEALMALRPPITGEDHTKPVSSDKYLAIASGYSGTAAGRQALLLAGEAQFLEGKYDQARATFQQFLTANPGHTLSSQADLGIAACWDAAGKAKEALEAYDMVRKRYPQENGIVSHAKLAMGRLNEDQGKAEQAYLLYKELTDSMRFGFSSFSMEARERMVAMEKANPKLAELNQPPKPAMTPNLPIPMSNAVMVPPPTASPK